MNKAFFVLPKGNNFKRGEVLTTPTEKTNIKTPSSVIVSPVPVKRIDNEIPTNDKKTPIKGLFIGVNKDIPVHSFYISDSGDLNMFGTLTRTREIVYDNPNIREVKLIHESFPVSETVCKGDFTISNQQYIKKELVANSGTITFIEPVYVESENDTDTEIEENDNTIVRTRTVHKALTGDVLTLCTLTYGDGRKVREHTSSKGIVEYVAQNRPKDGGGLIYEGILTCAKENEALAISIIKEITKTWKKSTICWE